MWISRRRAAIASVKAHTSCNRRDALSALNYTCTADDDVSSACRVMPWVQQRNARKRADAARRKADSAAAVRFAAGDDVQVRALCTNAELNGKLGRVLRFLPERERYLVQLECRANAVRIKGQNLQHADLVDGWSLTESEEEEGAAQDFDFDHCESGMSGDCCTNVRTSIYYETPPDEDALHVCGPCAEWHAAEERAGGGDRPTVHTNLAAVGPP